jgi:hypothetical protein
MYMYTFLIDFLVNNVLPHAMCTVYYVYDEQFVESFLKTGIEYNLF